MLQVHTLPTDKRGIMDFSSCLILLSFCLPQHNIWNKTCHLLLSFVIMCFERGLNDEGCLDVARYIEAILIFYMVAAVGYALWAYPIVSTPEPKFSALLKQRAIRNRFRHRNLRMRHATPKTRKTHNLGNVINKMVDRCVSCITQYSRTFYFKITESDLDRAPDNGE